MTTAKYPTTLSRSIQEIVINEKYTINQVLDSFQTNYSETKLGYPITQTMRNTVVKHLKQTH